MQKNLNTTYNWSDPKTFRILKHWFWISPKTTHLTKIKRINDRLKEIKKKNWDNDSFHISLIILIHTLKKKRKKLPYPSLSHCIYFAPIWISIYTHIFLIPLILLFMILKHTTLNPFILLNWPGAKCWIVLLLYEWI